MGEREDGGVNVPGTEGEGDKYGGGERGEGIIIEPSRRLRWYMMNSFLLLSFSSFFIFFFDIDIDIEGIDSFEGESAINEKG